MKIFFLAALLLIPACTTKPHTVVYTSSWHEQWQNEILEKCSSESQVITFAIIDSRISAGYDVTEEYVQMLEKHLMDSCVKYYQITI